MSDIQAIIWDLDNTLYRFSTLFEEACNHVAGATLRALGVDIDDASARDRATRSFEQYGYSMRAFIDDYGLCHETVHHEFHKWLDVKVIEASHELVETFKHYELRHILVTHGSRHWALRALEHLNLKQFFHDHMLFGLEDYDYQKKNESPFVFDMARDLLRVENEQIMMVEDTLPNLKHPHELGMRTVFVHHGRTLPEGVDFVDHLVDSAQDVFPLTKA